MRTAGLCLLTIAFIVEAWIIGMDGAIRWWQGNKLDDHGLLAQARIVDRYSWTEDKGGSKSYWVKVNFVPKGGERINVETRVSAEYLKTHDESETSRVMVRYLPEAPTIAVVEGERPFVVTNVVAGGLLCGGLVLAGFSAWKFLKTPFWAGGHF